jgi:NAD(P)-dependent dehydrogenase (short-subunit alcohol dehydrogenase family)
MIARGAGRIINLSSNTGAHRWPFLSPYAVSKAAVIKLTENLALETRRHDVSVFAIHPGTVNVGPTKNLLESDVPDGSPEAKVKGVVRRTDRARRRRATGDSRRSREQSRVRAR